MSEPGEPGEKVSLPPVEKKIFRDSDNPLLSGMVEERSQPDPTYDQDRIFIGWEIAGKEMLEDLIDEKLDQNQDWSMTEARTRALREFSQHVGSRRGKVFMDRSEPDVLFVGGKRGSGKSFNLRAISNRSAVGGVTNIIIDVENEFCTNNMYSGIQSGDRNLRSNESPQNVDTKVLMPYFVYKARQQQGMPERGYSYMDVFKFGFDDLTPDDIGYLISKMGDHRDYTVFKRAIERRIRDGRAIKSWRDVIEVARELDEEGKFNWGNGGRVEEIETFIEYNYEEYGLLGSDFNIDLKQILNEYNSIALSLNDGGGLPSEMEMSELYIALLVKNVRNLVERGNVEKPIHWVVDEADWWIPASNPESYHPSRAQFEKVTLDDRKRGFRATFATQKPGKVQQGASDLSEDPFMGETDHWLIPGNMKPGPRRRMLKASGFYQLYREQWDNIFKASNCINFPWIYLNEKTGNWVILEVASPLAYHRTSD